MRRRADSHGPRARGGWRSSGPARARRPGFTLLEMLVAAVLLAIGLLAALEVVGHSARASREASDRSRALMFARSKLEEILKEPVLQTGTDRGQGVDTSTDYDWEAAIEPSANPSLVVITVVVRNRITGVETAVTALRRPDLTPTASGETAAAEAPAEGETDTGGAGGTR